MALVIALVMCMSMSMVAFAEGEGDGNGDGGNSTGASITIRRDSSWDEDADTANATYTYYKIFDAKDIDQDVDEESGEQTEDSNGVAVYWVDSLAKANALPNIFKVSNKVPSEVTAADAASDGKFYVTLASSSTGAEAIATALKTMVEANSTLFPEQTVTSNQNPVVISGLDAGYYLIKASNGSTLAVQTLDDVTIYEKNDYPTVDKKQGETADEIVYDDEALTVQVGDYINYQITVHIPANANKDIVVVDKMSAGLEWDEDFGTNGLSLTPAIAYSTPTDEDEGYATDATWQIKFAADTVANNQDSDIVITYRAKVTAAALTDTDRENEVTLTYDEGNYVLTDDVDYTVYFGGIYKVDPNDDNADMSGVKFTLADSDGNAVNVTYVSDGGYYIVDASSTSNEVETRADGTNYTIKIRGLDGDKTYKLTETETKAGYNLLEGEAELSLTEDTGTAFSGKVANTYDRVENNKGATLPSTGGIGTTIFYVIGAVLVIGAGVLLVTRRRMRAE